MDGTVAALATRKQNQRKKTEAQSLLPCCAHSPVPQAEKGGGMKAALGTKLEHIQSQCFSRSDIPQAQPRYFLPESDSFQGGLQRSYPWDSRPCGLLSLYQGWFV